MTNRFEKLTMPPGLRKIPAGYGSLGIRILDAGPYDGSVLNYTDPVLEHLTVRGPHIRTIRVNPHAIVEIPQEHHFNKIVIERVDQNGKVVRKHIPNNHSYHQPVRQIDKFSSMNGKVPRTENDFFFCRHISAFEDDRFTDDERDERPGSLGLRIDHAQNQKRRLGSQHAVQSNLDAGLEQRYNSLNRMSTDCSVFAAERMGSALHSRFSEMGEEGSATYLFDTARHSMAAFIRKQKDAEGRTTYHLVVSDSNEGPTPLQRQTDNLDDVKTWGASDFLFPKNHAFYFRDSNLASLTTTPRGAEKRNFEAGRRGQSSAQKKFTTYLRQNEKPDASLISFFKSSGQGYSTLLPQLRELPNKELIRQIGRDFVRSATILENENIITNHFSLFRDLAQSANVSADQIAHLSTQGQRKTHDGQTIPTIADAVVKGNSAAIRKYWAGIRSLVEANVFGKEDMAKLAPLWNAETMASVRATIHDKTSPNRHAAKTYRDMVREVRGRPPASSKQEITFTRL